MQSPQLVYIYGSKVPVYIIKTISDASDPEKIPASARVGVMALTTSDGKVYMKDFDGTFKEILAGGGGGGSHGIYLGLVTNGDSFPTERPDHTPLENEDYVRPSADSTFPFTIGSVTFTSSLDKAIYNSGSWFLEPGAIQDTDETPLSSPATESFYGDRVNQAQVNADNATYFKDMFSGTTYTDLDTLEETDILNRVYHQTEDTTQRTAGYYIYDFTSHEWNKFGAGDIPNGDTLPSGKYDGELFILNVDISQASGIVPKGLYKYNGSAWSLVANETALRITASNSTTIDTYEVPVLTDTEIAQAYDSFNAGHIVAIQDSHKYQQMAVIEISNLTGKAIKVLYRDVMVIEYVTGGAINYTTLLNKQTTYSELHTSHKTILDAINEVADIETYKFKGYVSSTEPTSANKGAYWYESDNMPTTFPIAVKTFNGSTWSSDTINYTPLSLDLWANLNNDKGYYWFGNDWNLIDVDVSYDDVSINKNASGQLQVKSKVNNKALSGGDIVLDTNDIKANNTQTVQHNLERIDDELGVRQIVHLISEFPEELEDYDLYRVEEEFTHESKTYSVGLYQVISNDLSKIEPAEGVAVDGETIEFNTDGELAVKDSAITNEKINDNLKATAITNTASDTKLATEKAVKDYAIPVTAPIIRQASGLISAGNTSTKVRLQQKENGTEQMISYNAYYELGTYDDILLDFEYGVDSIGRYVEFSIATSTTRNIAIQVTIMTWEV